MMTIENAIGKFWLEGYDEDKAGVVAYAEFLGENGERTTFKFTNAGEAAGLAELLWECAVDLNEAQTEGIMSVVARKGEDKDTELTVDDILGVANDPIKDVDNVSGNLDNYPWSNDDNDPDSQ